MADSLADLLANREVDEPGEIRTIKSFIDRYYQAECQVSVNGQQIIIQVRGSSLAGAIRMRLHEIKRLCQTDKRLVIRVLG